MLQVNSKFSELPGQGSELLSPTELLFQGIGIVRRNLAICAGVPAAFVVLALIYLMMTPPQFTATAVMVIDTRKSSTLLPGTSSPVETPIDNPTVESQAEILKSENIAMTVIRDLKLVDDPTFLPPSPIGDIFGAIRSLVSSAPPYTEFQRTRSVVGEFGRRLGVKRVGVTFVFEVSFTHADREKAAKIANAVADAYVVDQLEAKYATTRRAGVWLQDRLKELGKQASDADRAVVAYKATNNIVDTGGRLLNEQQVAELNSQLAVARANVSESSAKLARIQDVMRQDVPDANVTDALHNEVIIKLRNQFTDLTKREGDLLTRVGPNHQAVINIRNDMQELRKSIRDELRRIGASYQSDHEIAKVRLETIQASLQDVVSQSQTTSKAQVELKQLESAAQSYRALYDSFLQRYMETVQQQSFPLTEARIVTQATPPLKKSKPRSGLTVLGAMLGGALVGFAIGWIRDRADKTLRTAADVEASFGIACVASVPLLNAGEGARSPLYEVVLRPISRFAEAIRAIKVAVDFFPSTRKPQAVGIVSSVAGEGKSTIAANLAAMAANSGSRAILIDADLRNPSLTAKLAPQAKAGLQDVLAGRRTEGAILQIPELRCDFIPVAVKDRIVSSSELTSASGLQALKILLEKLKGYYDYVIIDLPPLVPVIDARAAADVIDCFVIVAEWGETPAELVQTALQSSPRIQVKAVGIALNKLNTASESRYYEYSGAHTYYPR